MITAQELADFACDELQKRIKGRIITKRTDFGYSHDEYADIDLGDDAMLRVKLTQQLTCDFQTSQRETRKSIHDRYVIPALEAFVRTFRKVQKNVVVSVPMEPRKDPGIEFARAVDDIHVVAYSLVRPNGEVRYGVETLFGTFNV